MTYYAYFIMTYNEYMKAYRLKNRDRINEQQRSRRGSKSSMADAVLGVVESRKPVVTKSTIEPVKVVDPVISKELPKSACKCIYCWSMETTIKTINGGPYPVCAKHINKP